MKRVQLETEVAAQDPVTQHTGGTRLVNRFFKTIVIGPDFTVNVVVADRDTHRICTDRHAFDQRMRVIANDVAILEGTRFAFVGIADQVFLSRELARHEAPLQAGRKTCTATPTQRRRFQFGDDLFRRNFLVQNALQRFVTTALDVIGQMPILPVEICENQRIDVTIVQAGHCDAPSSDTSSSIFSFDIQLHMRLLLTSITGASPQAPMHSPSSTVNCPSAVVSL